MKLLALLSVALIFSGCVSENNQELIALATLYPDDTPADPNRHPAHPRPAPILTSALNSKFPPGTDLEGLKSYVAKLRGSCYQKELGQPMRCSFIESGTICWEVSVSITAMTNSLNKIENIHAARISSGC